MRYTDLEVLGHEIANRLNFRHCAVQWTTGKDIEKFSVHVDFSSSTEWTWITDEGLIDSPKVFRGDMEIPNESLADMSVEVLAKMFAESINADILELLVVPAALYPNDPLLSHKSGGAFVSRKIVDKYVESGILPEDMTIYEDSYLNNIVPTKE